ncbi:RnfH family protein [Pandoraea sp. CB10b_02]|uniref:RnfH family protein n=1 Tax=Pandoraea sp. CB10b_02 TaxID=2014535 RepID=UPI00257AA442|nr:RnfH family protein [Pandoraea sp. CB10b_02]
MPGEMKVEVCYALPAEQTIVVLELPEGATVGDAIERSGLLLRYPELDLARVKTGVFGKVRALDALVEAGDRVEIYRPLKADPKVARQRRVEKVRNEGSREGQKWLGSRRSG